MAKNKRQNITDGPTKGGIGDVEAGRDLSDDDDRPSSDDPGNDDRPSSDDDEDDRAHS